MVNPNLVDDDVQNSKVQDPGKELKHRSRRQGLHLPRHGLGCQTSLLHIQSQDMVSDNFKPVIFATR